MLMPDFISALTTGELEALSLKDLEYIPDELGGAVRADKGKLRYELLPPGPIEDLVKVLSWGAEKYDDDNWKKGMSWKRCYASTMRHLQAWFQGEDKDPESGLDHLAHVLCNVVFLQYYADRHPDLDDRDRKES